MACRIRILPMHRRGDSYSFQSICRPATSRVAYRIRTNALTRRRSNSESRLQERAEDQDKDQSRSEACPLLQHRKEHSTMLLKVKPVCQGTAVQWLREEN